MLYRIIGVIDEYGDWDNPISHQEEVIDQFETKSEAEDNLAQYRMAFGSNWKLYIV